MANGEPLAGHCADLRELDGVYQYCFEQNHLWTVNSVMLIVYHKPLCIAMRCFAHIKFTLDTFDSSSIYFQHSINNQFEILNKNE